MKRNRQKKVEVTKVVLYPQLLPEIWNEILSKLGRIEYIFECEVCVKQVALGSLMRVDKTLHAYISKQHERIIGILRGLYEDYKEKLFIKALNLKYKKSEWFICHECNSLIAGHHSEHEVILLELADGQEAKVCHTCLSTCEYCDEDYCASSLNQHQDCTEFSQVDEV